MSRLFSGSAVTKTHAHPSAQRRHWLRTAGGLSLALGSLALFPEARLYAQAASDFIKGPDITDIAPVQLSPHVWVVIAADSFPTAENRGMMANITFVVTEKGVVILDSGASLQIGEMVIRMIKTVTNKPVIAVFNSHYHGDHWLGNHAFVQAYGSHLPIYALPHTLETIRGIEGNTWRNLMERWTNQATIGTEVVPPNKTVEHGQLFNFGDVHLKMHHYCTAHTPSDLCVEIIEDRITHIGDIAMDKRIANIDDGSFTGTFKYFDELSKNTQNQKWLPGHGLASADLLSEYGDFLKGIYEPCLKAVQDGKDLSQAKALVLKDPRVKNRAATMQGFEANIGKYVSLAYLEAEREAF
jgi:glyoxylase-like metal-dependent hydrolase (beta-lactamase superfamily II)